jgi:hypothetical protein
MDPSLHPKFWMRFFELLSIKMKLSLVSHPYTDGQTKLVNQILKQYLHYITNYHQDNWSNLLCMVDFFYNNMMHLLTHQTYLFINHGLHTRFDI